jgi:hypothetical protein
MTLLVAVLAGLVVGFLGGVMAVKAKQWCQGCGVTLECPACLPATVGTAELNAVPRRHLIAVQQKPADA